MLGVPHDGLARFFRRCISFLGLRFVGFGLKEWYDIYEK